MNTKTHTDEKIVAHFAKLGFTLHKIKDSIFREEQSTFVFQTDHKNHTVDASTILYKDAENIYQAIATARASQDILTEQRVKREVVEVVYQLLKVPELYGGKLPYVVFGGKADEKEKVAIYIATLNDVLKAFTTTIKGTN